MILFDKLITEKSNILDKIFSLGDNYTLLLTYFNQHCFNIYFKNNTYKNLIDESFEVYSEGIGMYLFCKFIIKKRVKRIDATFLYDLMNKIIHRSESIFLIGGNFNEQRLKEELEQKRLNLAGYQNGYFNDDEKDAIFHRISSTQAKYVVIGMGVPNQEIFAFELSQKVTNKIFICVGNFLEFYFGTIKRAPGIFQKTGLEWLFRLASEPKRLWKRYIFGIPEFIYRVIRIKM